MARYVYPDGVQWLVEHGVGDQMKLMLMENWSVTDSVTSAADVAAWETSMLGYARVPLTGVGVAVSGSQVQVTADSVVFQSLGVPSGPTVSAVVVTFDVPGNSLLVAAADVTVPTSGEKVTVTFPPAGFVTFVSSLT